MYQLIISRKIGISFLQMDISHGIWVFPKCFHWIQRIQLLKIFFIKRICTCHLLCKRPGWFHSTSNKQGRNWIFKLGWIHVSVSYQIPWIPVSFLENSFIRVQMVDILWYDFLTYMSKCHTIKWGHRFMMWSTYIYVYEMRSNKQHIRVQKVKYTRESNFCAGLLHW